MILTKEVCVSFPAALGVAVLGAQSKCYSVGLRTFYEQNGDQVVGQSESGISFAHPDIRAAGDDIFIAITNRFRIHCKLQLLYGCGN